MGREKVTSSLVVSGLKIEYKADKEKGVIYTYLPKEERVKGRPKADNVLTAVKGENAAKTVHNFYTAKLAGELPTVASRQPLKPGERVGAGEREQADRLEWEALSSHLKHDALWLSDYDILLTDSFTVPKIADFRAGEDDKYLSWPYIKLYHLCQEQVKSEKDNFRYYSAMAVSEYKKDLERKGLTLEIWPPASDPAFFDFDRPGKWREYIDICTPDFEAYLFKQGGKIHMGSSYWHNLQRARGLVKSGEGVRVSYVYRARETKQQRKERDNLRRVRFSARVGELTEVYQRTLKTKPAEKRQDFDNYWEGDTGHYEYGD